MGLAVGQIALDENSLEGGMVITTALELNAHDLEQELAWFSSVLDTRFKLYFGQEATYQDVFEITPPDLNPSASPYARFIHHYQATFSERIAIVLALIPHIRPQLLDIFFIKNKTFDRKFSEFGGIWNSANSDFMPTGETLLFILAANKLAMRFQLQHLFDDSHYFAKHNILRLSRTDDVVPMKAALHLSEESLSYFTTGQLSRPNFGANFPARYIETQLSWDELVLHPDTRKQVEEIATWLQHGRTLMVDWGMASKLRPGYRTLFYGPPGTGKTMTACLLGKSTERDVYKIDLSLVVSKFIGETEKNLAKIFDQAQNKDWILFFDEADALFGKRSQTKDAHDRYANQEVAFLLQRIEDFDGIAILASNQRDNLDEAFARRFESIIYFPVPRPEERFTLWQQGFSEQARLDKALDLHDIAQHHTLTGGAIMNAIRYASLQALKCGSNIITKDDVLTGIQREYAKEGKTG